MAETGVVALQLREPTKVRGISELIDGVAMRHYIISVNIAIDVATG